MKRKLIAALAVLMIFLLCPLGAGAAVDTVTEPTDGDHIYIAGNPDMYPIEYYDDESGSYKGVLPELYKKISERSGIDFSYVSAGRINEQKRMADNKQVEMVSAYSKGEINHLKKEVKIVSFGEGNNKTELYVGFTSIASDELVKTVSEELQKTSDDELLGLTVVTASSNPPDKFPAWLLIVAVVLFAVCIVFLLLALRKHRREKQELREKLIDPVTGIGNKLYFEKQYRKLVTPETYALYYIVYIGLDAERVIQYSEPAVSEEIQVFAATELSLVAKDKDFYARLSDGRFAVAFEAVTDEEAARKADKLIQRMNQFAGEVVVKYHIKFQAGIFHLDAPDIQCEKALFNARHGFYHARENNLAYVFSDMKLLKREEYISGLKKKLRKALDEKEFKIYTQYIYDSSGKTVCGAEALSRWESPDSGVILPGEYIKMLETAEMIGELDMYNLGECCRTLENWREGAKQNLWLSCNMTRLTLSDPAFPERLRKLTAGCHFDRSKLIIEITESAMEENVECVVRNIIACKEMGFRTALDDFGSGYSSLKNLNDYPIDIIKIDRKIISDAKGERGGMLLFGIIGLAHYLGIEALCEGVETPEEIAVSQYSRCDYLQGYLLARACPVDEPSVDKNLTFA